MAEIATSVMVLFLSTTIASLGLFYKVTRRKTLLLWILVWMVVVGVLGDSGFFRVQGTWPPRFTLLLMPAALLVIAVVFLKPFQKFVASLDLKWLTLIHVVRIPVEIVLYNMCLEGLIPDLMTFKTYNLDILAGLSAPVVYYAVFVKKWMDHRGLLIWNFISLGLILNIVIIAVLSAETPFQQFAFDQPNVGVTYVPFVWLPSVIVPMVIMSHLVSIKRLIVKSKGDTEVFNDIQ